MGVLCPIRLFYSYQEKPMSQTKGRDIHMDHVSMKYPGSARYAVSDIDVHIQAGEFFSFLGPSGCGKTTLLRLVSGFLDPTGGVIRIGGDDMRGIGPNKRPTAMIFQNLALFPLMTVSENIGFGLEVRGVNRSERAKRADELLELVDLPGTGRKKVSDLSGGQRQRVAIARGLAVEPAVLLLDEPLSALDLKLRQHMRTELRKIQRRTKVTFVYITHDQGEALTMSDRIGVLSGKGELLQVDTATGLYNEPGSAFVADFVGENNAFPAMIESATGDVAVAGGKAGVIRGKNPKNLTTGKKAMAFVRPEAIFPATSGNGINGSADINTFSCKVLNLSFEGPYVTLFLTNGHDRFTMRLNNDGHTEIPQRDSEIMVAFKVDNTRFLPSGEVFNE